MKRYLSIILLILLSWIEGIGQQPFHLPSEVNSIYEEREPILSNDGKQLFIWRRKHPGNAGGEGDQGDIWVSNRTGLHSYSQAVPFYLPLNSAGLEFLWQLSPGGDTFYVSQVISNRDPGLYYTTRERGVYRPLKRLYIQGFFPRGKHRDYIMTSQGDMLIPNETANGFGGPDLFICFRINDTTWSQPLNLGPTINSAGDEDAPFLLPDGKTLFFNSNGHGSNGKHDVYFSRRLDDSWQNWSKPEPIGAPINSPENEADFVVTDNGEMAYWISDNVSNGSYDIFQMPIAGCDLDVYPKGDHVMCEGESIELEAGFTLAERHLSYQWQRDGRDIPGETGRKLLVRETGNYQVVRKKDDCTNTSSPMRISVIPSPQVTIESPTNFICEEDSILLKAVSAEASSWEWVKNGLSIPRANRPELWVKRPGSYYVKVSNGVCGSATKSIRVGKMERPIIYPSDQALIRARTLPNEWLWTQEFREKKDKYSLQDMSSDGEGKVVILGREHKGRKSFPTLSYFDRNGTLLWKKVAEKGQTQVGSQLVQMDYEGNIFVLQAEKYLTKYDANGRLLWERGASGEMSVAGLTTDPQGHVYAMLRYKGELTLNGKDMPARSDGGALIQKYDPWGELKWSRILSLPFSEKAQTNSLGCDASGNLYVAGEFTDKVVFEGEEILRSSSGEANAFVARYFPDGKLHWARRYTAPSFSPEAVAMHSDPSGNTFLLFKGKMLKYDPYGRIVWRAEGHESARFARIAVDRQGTLFSLYLLENNQYSLSRTDKRGNVLEIWTQKSMSKEEGNLPAIASNEGGRLFVAGIANGKAPSKASIDALPAFVTAFGPPDHPDVLAPISICPGESLDLIVKIPRDLPYYWLKDGKPIAGATDTLLKVTERGLYTVRAFSGGCQQYANLQQVEDCYQALTQPKEEPQPPKKEEVKEPEPPKVVTVDLPKPREEAREEPEPDAKIRTTITGNPTSLNNRKVKRQGGVRISNPKVKISVWDRGAVDNDTISLNVNGRWLVENYALRKEAKVFEVEFNPDGANYIILFAHNLGIFPPNTATVSIDDGTQVKVFKLKSSLNDCGSINVKLDK